MTTSHLTASMWAQPRSEDKHDGKRIDPAQPALEPLEPLKPTTQENTLPADDLIELTTPTLTAEDIPWESRLVYQPHLHRWPT